MALRKSNIEPMNFDDVEDVVTSTYKVETTEQPLEADNHAVYEMTAPVTTEVAKPVYAAPANSLQGGSILRELAEAGHNGLRFDFTSFPQITLQPEAIFEDSENTEYGKEFFCKILETNPRWIIKAGEDELIYSYDRVTASDGSLVSDHERAWRQEGRRIEYKEYYEALVEMVAPDTVYDGDLRVLSVSPTSKGRYSSHMAKIAMNYGVANTNNIVTRVFVGSKIKDAKIPFYPWGFEAVKPE